MAFCHATQFQFAEAAECMDVLRRESKWSKAIYTYLYAIYRLASPASGDVKDLMASVPGYVQRIAGKRIPTEKFAASRAKRFSDTGALFLPVYEMTFLIWQGFGFLSVANLERALATVQQHLGKAGDDTPLALLLQAVLYRYLGRVADAEKVLTGVLGMTPGAHLDYVHPFAHIELARLYLTLGEDATVRQHLEHAKRQKNYILENLIHFRAHNLYRNLDGDATLDDAAEDE